MKYPKPELFEPTEEEKKQALRRMLNSSSQKKSEEIINVYSLSETAKHNISRSIKIKIFFK